MALCGCNLIANIHNIETVFGFSSSFRKGVVFFLFIRKISLNILFASLLGGIMMLFCCTYRICWFECKLPFKWNLIHITARFLMARIEAHQCRHKNNKKNCNKHKYNMRHECTRSIQDALDKSLHVILCYVMFEEISDMIAVVVVRTLFKYTGFDVKWYSSAVGICCRISREMKTRYSYSSSHADEIKFAWHIVKVNKDIHLPQNPFADGIPGLKHGKFNRWEQKHWWQWFGIEHKWIPAFATESVLLKRNYF